MRKKLSGERWHEYWPELERHLKRAEQEHHSNQMEIFLNEVMPLAFDKIDKSLLDIDKSDCNEKLWFAIAFEIAAMYAPKMKIKKQPGRPRTTESTTVYKDTWILAKVAQHMFENDLGIEEAIDDANDRKIPDLICSRRLFKSIQSRNKIIWRQLKADRQYTTKILNLYSYFKECNLF